MARQVPRARTFAPNKNSSKQDLTPVTITSYNSTGFPVQRQTYIKSLQLYSDVICGQEHFQLKNCKFRISNAFSNEFDFFFKPAVKSNSSLGKGRPKGGLYFAWKKHQVKKATRIPTENFRMQALILEYENCKILLINTYFPCDSKRLVLSDTEAADLQNLLSNISSLKKKYSSKFDTAFILGDINYDNLRYTGHTLAVNNFLDSERLSSVWDFFPADFTFSSGDSHSTLDHFFISSTQSHIVLEAGPIHDPDNLSGHCPIYMKIDLAKANNPPEELARNPRLNWGRSTPEQQQKYTEKVNDLISQLEHDSHCDDLLCVNVDHLHGIDALTGQLLGAITDSAWENLEASKGTTGDQSSRSHTIPGWNDRVKPFHSEARFWYSLWTSAGKPKHSSVPGVEHNLFSNMKYSRNQYHFAVRRTQNSLNLIENDKLVCKMNSPELFEEIKKICKEKSSNVSSVIDDIHGSKNITEHFKTIYENLYNEQENVDRDFIREINDKVAENAAAAKATISLFTADLVKTAVKKLKPDKSDVTGNFTSDCLKAAPEIFFENLSELFKTSLSHGYFSHDLLVCALSPIVKDSNGDISSSKNYRGIAISSLILKVFDNCILLLFGSFLSNDVLQFGFQKGCSTVQCTWAVQETISNYLRKGSEVYCCLLDFSKAFDKVNFKQLFEKLIERELPPIILRLILGIYLNQSCFIRWNSVESSSFRVKNGVRQGAILSPSLFCVYLDTLLSKLREAGVGCHLGGSFMGAFGYADDVTLLAPSRQGLQLMLKICEDFASSHSMQFSTDPVPSKSKSKCLFFSRERSAADIDEVLLNGDKLPWVSTAKHLGNHLSSKLNLSFFSPETRTDLLCKRAILFEKVHEVMQQFGYLKPELVIKLLCVYSTALYGSNLWQVNSAEHLQLNKSWNTAMKIIWDLPFATHTRFLESLSPVPHLESVLTGRYLGFLNNFLKTSNSALGLIFSNCKNNISSQTGQNIKYLMDKHKMDSLGNLVDEKNTLKKLRVYTLPEEEKWKVSLLKEIALIKKGQLDIDFDEKNLEEILEAVCTD